MKKFKNKLKKIIICVLSAAMMLLCSVVSVFADEEATTETVDSNLGVESTPDGQVVPFLPSEVYGKNYILINTGNDSTSGSGRIIWLYLLPDDAVVTARNYDSSGKVYNGSGGQVINFTLPSGTYVSKYFYKDSSGWSEPEIVTTLNLTVTPSSLFILRSTVDILNTDYNSIVYFSKNADIIYEPQANVVLVSFGSMLSGFLGCTTESAIGIFCFTCIVATGIIGIITHMAKVRY